MWAASSPELEEELAKEAALYKHSKTSLDGLKSKQTFNKSKRNRSKIDTAPTTGIFAWAYRVVCVSLIEWWPRDSTDTDAVTTQALTRLYII